VSDDLLFMQASRFHARHAMFTRRAELIAAHPELTGDAGALAPLMGDLQPQYWEWCLERFFIREEPMTEPRTFWLQRIEDVTGASGTGHVADGVLWSDGTVTVKWLGEFASEVSWPKGMEAVERIHGHDGRTVVVWYDRNPAPASREGGNQ
jgi:hypothetical protein